MDVGQESAELEEHADRYEAEAQAAEQAGQRRRSRQLRESARASRRLSREKRAQGDGDGAEGTVRRWWRRLGGS
jgi:hypothetical protein